MRATNCLCVSVGAAPFKICSWQVLGVKRGRRENNSSGSQPVGTFLFFFFASFPSYVCYRYSVYRSGLPDSCMLQVPVELPHTNPSGRIRMILCSFNVICQHLPKNVCSFLSDRFQPKPHLFYWRHSSGLRYKACYGTSLTDLYWTVYRCGLKHIWCSSGYRSQYGSCVLYIVQQWRNVNQAFDRDSSVLSLHWFGICLLKMDFRSNGSRELHTDKMNCIFFIIWIWRI